MGRPGKASNGEDGMTHKDAMEIMRKVIEEDARRVQGLLNMRPPDIGRDVWLQAVLMNFIDARLEGDNAPPKS